MLNIQRLQKYIIITYVYAIIHQLNLLKGILMTIYIHDETEKKLRKLAEKERRSLSKQIDTLIEAYEKKVQK